MALYYFEHQINRETKKSYKTPKTLPSLIYATYIALCMCTHKTHISQRFHIHIIVMSHSMVPYHTCLFMWYHILLCLSASWLPPLSLSKNTLQHNITLCLKNETCITSQEFWIKHACFDLSPPRISYVTLFQGIELGILKNYQVWNHCV